MASLLAAAVIRRNGFIGVLVSRAASMHMSRAVGVQVSLPMRMRGRVVVFGQAVCRRGTIGECQRHRRSHNTQSICDG